MSLRAARADDVAQLSALDTASGGGGWSASQFATWLSTTLVLEDQAAILGFVTYSSVLDEAEILNIAVTTARRREGLGQRLWSAALAQFQRDGVQRCHLEVRAGNEAAIAFYHALGFAPTGTRKNYYSGPAGREDALLMTLVLETDA